MTESRRPRFRFDLVTFATIAVGLLFWARLIIVTDMPRMAVAEDDGRRTPSAVAPAVPAVPMPVPPAVLPDGTATSDNAEAAPAADETAPAPDAADGVNG